MFLICFFLFKDWVRDRGNQARVHCHWDPDERGRHPGRREEDNLFAHGAYLYREGWSSYVFRLEAISVDYLLDIVRPSEYANFADVAPRSTFFFS